VSAWSFSGLPSNEVVPRLKEKVADFRLVMPCITSLRNPSLRSRHWDQIEVIIGKSIQRNKEFTLGDLLDMNVSILRCTLKSLSFMCANLVVYFGLLSDFPDSPIFLRRLSLGWCKYN
jgi:dynein heavy chain